ncbi:MAG TPA: hypothetical protein VMF66_15480 [Candidatus Acidoferrum sp.]|nr:hypothetical protein [Candidatus Acidoferrum sp.]
MKRAISPTICAIALTFAVSINVSAQATPVPSDVKAFAAQYVAAFNAKDKARLISLNLFQSRACITPANKDIYDSVLFMNMRDPVPPNYMLSLIPVNEGNLKALANEEYFPVAPERELHIDYQYPETRDGGQLILWLVRQNGRWVGDFPCMTAQGIKNFREDAAAREQYKKLAAGIKDPLRSQLIAMLRKHETGEAEERYQKATGSDIRTSVLVIDALADQMH